jgi:hypothetical protein
MILSRTEHRDNKKQAGGNCFGHYNAVHNRPVIEVIAIILGIEPD